MGKYWKAVIMDPLIIVKFLFLSKKKILQFFTEAFLEKYYLDEYLNHLEWDYILWDLIQGLI